MSEWRVYAGAPLARTVGSKRAARRLQRRYARLGIQASLYESQDGDWVLREKYDSTGQPVPAETTGEKR